MLLQTAFFRIQRFFDFVQRPIGITLAHGGGTVYRFFGFLIMLFPLTQYARLFVFFRFQAAFAVFGGGFRFQQRLLARLQLPHFAARILLRLQKCRRKIGITLRRCQCLPLRTLA